MKTARHHPGYRWKAGRVASMTLSCRMGRMTVLCAFLFSWASVSRHPQVLRRAQAVGGDMAQAVTVLLSPGLLLFKSVHADVYFVCLAALLRPRSS